MCEASWRLPCARRRWRCNSDGTGSDGGAALTKMTIDHVIAVVAVERLKFLPVNPIADVSIS